MTDNKDTTINPLDFAPIEILLIGLLIGSFIEPFTASVIIFIYLITTNKQFAIGGSVNTIRQLIQALVSRMGDTSEARARGEEEKDKKAQ
jgi:hypothetical protein